MQVTAVVHEVDPDAASQFVPSFVYSHDATPLPPVSAKVVVNVKEPGTYVLLVGVAVTVP